MECIILAGGFGTRLRSVVSDVPKPMAPIGDRPFLELLMDYLMDYGCTHFVLSTGYMHEKISAHFGETYRSVPVSYAVEKEPLGTGGGIRNAMQYCREENVVVLNGDTLFRIDYDDLQRFFHAHPTRLAVVLRQVDDTARYGSVSTDCSDRIIRFTEKNATGGVGTINGGIYIMNRTLLDSYTIGEPFSFEKDIMQRLFCEEAFYAYTSGAYFIDIGVPEDYQRLVEEVRNASLR